MGHGFWAVLNSETSGWDSFDRIDHFIFSILFTRFRSHWTEPAGLAALPDAMTVWRGQPRAAKEGLSWTLDKSVAEGFAKGHRGIAVPDPVVLERTIARDDVALVFNDHNEKEVVLWP